MQLTAIRLSYSYYFDTRIYRLCHGVRAVKPTEVLDGSVEVADYRICRHRCLAIDSYGIDGPLTLRRDG